MNRLRLAVVGTGALGRDHARILAAQPDVELVAVVDQSAENGQRAAEACGTHWAADPAEVLDLVDAAPAHRQSGEEPAAAEHLVAFAERGERADEVQ